MAEMFDQFVHRSASFGRQRWYTLPLSVLVHGSAIAALIAVPLMAADVLPGPHVVIADLVLPPPPTMPPMPPAPAPPTDVPAVQSLDPSVPPIEAPPAITPETTVPSLRDISHVTGIPGGVRCSAVPGGVPPCVGAVFQAPPGPVDPPVPTKPLPIGGQIREPVKIRHVSPVYPQIAQNAKISGVVILEAVIGIDGSVTDIRVLRSIPTLDAAAVEAVKQWKFRPTLLNGTPVAVMMTVTVTFNLR